MTESIHFLRPFWFLAVIPLFLVGFIGLKQKSVIDAWRMVCDAELLPHLLQIKGRSKCAWPLFLLMSSGLCMIIALAGPTWSRIAVPTYQQINPRVILLDMSLDMMEHDLSPNRLTRAKFKLHDILINRDAGQLGLIVYTGEPFVVSPLTDDGQTIDSLLEYLTPAIMPIRGNRLERALSEAKTLITNAGSQSGEILVLTSKIPSSLSVDAAQAVANSGFHISVMPILEDKAALPLFEPLAKAGRGRVIALTNTNADIEQWLASTHVKSTYQINDMNDIPLWRDEGRWFILIALLLLLPAFWRGWFTRINT